jgi:uncharacterized membrane protein
MEEWILYSAISCFLYSIWTISTKLASKTIDSSSMQVIQLPMRIVITLFFKIKRSKPGSALSMKSIGELNFYGFLFTILACAVSVVAGLLSSDALRKGGSGSAVAAITGCYPALSYLMSLILGLESLNSMKVLGVVLAVGSCCCFAFAE